MDALRADWSGEELQPTFVLHAELRAAIAEEMKDVWFNDGRYDQTAPEPVVVGGAVEVGDDGSTGVYLP